MSAQSRCIAAAVAAAALSLIAIPAGTTPAAASGSVVAFNGDASPGTIVVRTNERRLYLVLGQGRAMVYPVGVNLAHGDTGLFTVCTNGTTGCATSSGAVQGTISTCM